MKYIFVFIFLFLINPCWGLDTTWVHNIPCTDNAANTVVTNNGTGSNWSTNPVHTTSIYYDATYNCFRLYLDNYYILSAENWTSEDIYINFQGKLDRETPTSIEIWIVNGNGDPTISEQEFVLFRNTNETQLIFRCKGTGDESTHDWITIDYSPNTSTFSNFIIKIDANKSPWDISISVDGTILTGSWGTNPAAANFNSKLYFGSISVYEADVSFKNIKIIKSANLPSEKNSFIQYINYIKSY